MKKLEEQIAASVEDRKRLEEEISNLGEEIRDLRKGADKSQKMCIFVGKTCLYFLFLHSF